MGALGARLSCTAAGEPDERGVAVAGMSEPGNDGNGAAIARAEGVGAADAFAMRDAIVDSTVDGGGLCGRAKAPVGRGC